MEDHGHVFLGKCLEHFLQGLQPGDDSLCLLFPLSYVCALSGVTSQHHMFNQSIREKLPYCHMWKCLDIDRNIQPFYFQSNVNTSSLKH